MKQIPARRMCRRSARMYVLRAGLYRRAGRMKNAGADRAVFRLAGREKKDGCRSTIVCGSRPVFGSNDMEMYMKKN